ncbi:MAG: DUF1330 domain-containing protein [Alphaproteobacteria bacterium]|nr:DUF1330 domain-containing protein [Alphaproteobacteria bacterium]
MAKGYWIAHVDVTDPDAYREYVAANAKAFARFGARFIVRGGEFDSPEGKCRSRHVVLEFPSLEAARACYESPEYAHAKSLRRAASEADIIIAAGYDGPQPGDAR